MNREQLDAIINYICSNTDLSVSDFWDNDTQLNTFGALTISLCLISIANKMFNILSDIKDKL